MKQNIFDIFNLIQELAWYFGNQGFDGNCCCDLSLVEYMAIKKVFNKNDIGVLELGNSLNVTKSGASKIIDRIETKGYVLKKSSPVDGRVCCIAITDKGMQAIKKIENNYSEYIGNLLKDLNADNVDDIKNSLEVLVNQVHKNGFINKI